MARRKLKKARVRTARFQWPSPLHHLLATTLHLDNLSPDALEATAQVVKQLSHTFLEGSVASDGISEKYGDDPDFHRAYAAYFLQVNVPKLVELFHDANLVSTPPRHVLDLGTGPGTAVVATLIALAGTTRSVDITAVDHSRDFLTTTETLSATFRRHLSLPGTTRTVRANLTKALELPDPTLLWGDKHDLVILSNALAELSEDALEDLPEQFHRQFQPGTTVLFMEPAQRVPARRLLQIRDRLCALGWHVRYPCPGNYPCPALKRERDWCHHRLAWEAPDHITRIDALTGMNKNVLNFSPLVMESPGSPQQELQTTCSTPSLRVISEVRPTKGKMEITACGCFPDGSHLKVCMLENKRVSERNEEFMELCRYDRIEITNAELRPERLVLTRESELRGKG